MYFQNYDFAVRSGAEKMYQALDHIQEILSLWKVITGLCYVVCFVSVYTISCCLQCRVLVILVYARTTLYFFTSIYH